MNEFLSRNKWVVLAAVVLALVGLQAVVGHFTSDDGTSAQVDDAGSDNQVAANVEQPATPDADDDSADVAPDDEDSVDDDDGAVDSAEGYDPTPQDDEDDPSAQNESHPRSHESAGDPPPNEIATDNGDEGDGE